jgi:hypothetical protein
MKKNIMLGVNSKTNRCCKLYCFVPFADLDLDNLEESDFVHGATDWEGQDEIERTLGILKMKQTGYKLTLNTPLEFSGADYDCGHEYSWRFAIDEIHELTEV